SDDAGKLTGFNAVRAEIRAHRPLLDNAERGRQRACPQQQRQILRPGNVKAAADYRRAAHDRLIDARRAHHLVIEDDRKGFADILRGGAAELLGAEAVKTDRDNRLALLIGRLRPFQIFARDHHAVLDHIGPPVPLDGGQPLRARWHAPGSADIGGKVNQMEGELRGLAEQPLDAVRIIEAGKLDENAVLPLTLDIRFIDAGLVHAATDNLDRLIDGRADARRACRLARRQGECAALAIFDDDVTLAIWHDVGKIREPLA